MTYADLEIVDEHDQPVTHRATYEEVVRKGLWHRGVHVIIYTPDHEILMQKRAPSLLVYPGRVEISVGGGVGRGETPKAAALREVREEFGLTIPAKELRFIGKLRINHHAQGQYDRCFTYSYAVCLPKSKLNVQLNPNETSTTFFMTEKQLRQALRIHRIRHIGRITPLYDYWRYLLTALHE